MQRRAGRVGLPECCQSQQIRPAPLKERTGMDSSSCSSVAPLVKKRFSVSWPCSYLRFKVEFQWFFTLLSVRACSSLEIFAHLLEKSYIQAAAGDGIGDEERDLQRRTEQLHHDSELRLVQ